MINTLIIFGAQYLYLVIVGVTVLLVWFQPKERRIELLVCMAISFPLAYLLAKIGSALYGSPRPFVISGIPPLVPHSPDNGFPSDHTLFSVSLAALILMYDRRIGFFMMILAIGVGVSRILAGIHHGIDIVGSILIASGSIYVVWRFALPHVLKSAIVKKYIHH